MKTRPGFSSVDAFLVGIIFCLMIGMILAGFNRAVAKNNFVPLPVNTIIWQEKLSRQLGEVKIITLLQDYRNDCVEVRVFQESPSGILGVVDCDRKKVYMFDQGMVVEAKIILPDRLPFKGKDGKVRKYMLSYRKG